MTLSDLPSIKINNNLFGSLEQQDPEVLTILQGSRFWLQEHANQPILCLSSY